MADENPPRVDSQQRYALEFWLVVIMLVVMTMLVVIVLFKNLGNNAAETLTWRKDILAIIITAFGAWIGAGAAYFFGRENLRVATDGLLAMRNPSPKERLGRTSIKQIPPTPIDWVVKKTTSVNEVRDKLMNEPARWFLPIVREDGTLETVINEEAVWRYLLQSDPSPVAPPVEPPAAPPVEPPAQPPAAPPVEPPAQPPAAPPVEPPADKTVKDILAFLDKNEPLGRFRQIHVSVAIGTTVGAANDLMDSKHVFLAIVETDGKPTHFFTTSEVRKLLLQGE